ncbi:MAG: Fe2+-dependent dioxygenase [Cyanobacteria bacterium REEB459]|nr:Fe2+-dependent dioxygenase [Cyanobacteria bacterium REEB459]
MITCIDQVLTPDHLTTIHQYLESGEFVDGKHTAGIFAQPVKHNQQLRGDTDTAQAIRGIITQALASNALFQALARPHSMRPALINRYGPGMAYGWHTDNALMGDCPPTRSDLSLTLFLSQPHSYQGGELLIDDGPAPQSVKLAAGSMVLYPSTCLHAVAEVTDGVRLAAVTWVQSLVPDPHQREILFDLDTVQRSLFEKSGKTPEFDLIHKTYTNLLRRWVDL